MPHCFAVIGHGVVGSLFSQLLSRSGARVVSYDCLLDYPDTASRIRRKMKEDGSRACTWEEALGQSDYILSVATPQSCREIAERASRSLTKSQVFVDLNSTSPSAKRTIAASFSNGGGEFVEGVILGAVASSASPVILLGGPYGESTAQVFQQYGLAARFYSPEIGAASAFKMLRSIFSKGLEAVLVETLVAACRAGLLDEIWNEIQNTLSRGEVEQTLQTWIRSHARSAQRRCYEMEEVNSFLEEIGIAAAVPRACGQVFAHSSALGICEAFPEEPASFREIVEYLERNQRTRGVQKNVAP